MNKSFFITDNYKYFKPKFRDTINNFVSNGKLIKDSRNTIKSFNIDNLKLNIKRFKKPNFFNKIIYTFFRSTKAQRSFDYAKKLIELGIATPKPIFYYNKFKSGLIFQSFYCSENIDYDYDMDQPEELTVKSHGMSVKGSVSREDCCAAVMALIECCSCLTTKQMLTECCEDLLSGHYDQQPC